MADPRQKKPDRGGHSPRWTTWEDAVLGRWWGVLPAAKVAAKLPGRSVTACQVRASKLGLKSARWTEAMYGNRGFKGVEFYEGILADFTRLTAGQIAIKRQAPLNRVRCWIKRAKQYRDRGLLASRNPPKVAGTTRG